MKKKIKSSLQPIFIDLLARSSTMISENKIVSPVINLEQFELLKNYLIYNFNKSYFSFF